MVRAEDLAEKIWKKRGWKFVKLGGALDYVVETPDLGAVIVEVKGKNDHVRESQEKKMTELESMGIQCYLSFEESNFALTRWNVYRDSKKIKYFKIDLNNSCLKHPPNIIVNLGFMHTRQRSKSIIILDLWSSGHSLSSQGLKKVGSILSQLGFFEYELNKNCFFVEMSNADAEKYVKELKVLFIESDNFISNMNPIVEQIQDISMLKDKGVKVWRS